jgi:hypothetical protein
MTVFIMLQELLLEDFQLEMKEDQGLQGKYLLKSIIVNHGWKRYL